MGWLSTKIKALWTKGNRSLIKCTQTTRLTSKTWLILAKRWVFQTNTRRRWYRKTSNKLLDSSLQRYFSRLLLRRRQLTKLRNTCRWAATLLKRTSALSQHNPETLTTSQMFWCMPNLTSLLNWFQSTALFRAPSWELISHLQNETPSPDPLVSSQYFCPGTYQF